MADQAGGEKIFPASQHKKQQARQKGNVAKSQDLSAGVSLLAALGALWFFGPFLYESMLNMTRFYLSHITTLKLTTENLIPFTVDIMLRTGMIVAPIVAVLLVIGVLINLLQVGFLLAPEALIPKFDKINPFSGFAKFFSLRSLIELVKSILKVILITWVVYLTLKGRWEEVMTMCYLTPLGLLTAAGSIIAQVWFRVALVMFVLGIFDFGFQWWQHEQDLRMTQQEVREESKQLEGDPYVKARIRQIMRQVAQQRMMREVPKADVVVTNPTTYAVALRYDVSGMDAPIVIAKGVRLVAQRIRQLALENDVPIVEKPELARALYKTVDLNQPVPEDLYRAVADILRFVFEIDRRADKIREREAFLAAAGMAPSQARA